MCLQEEDAHYFTYRDVNRTTVSLLLAKSLEDLVDTENPRNVLKFKISCDYDDGEDTVSFLNKQLPFCPHVYCMLDEDFIYNSSTICHKL